MTTKYRFKITRQEGRKEGRTIYYEGFFVELQKQDSCGDFRSMGRDFKTFVQSEPKRGIFRRRKRLSIEKMHKRIEKAKERLWKDFVLAKSLEFERELPYA